MAWPSIGNAFLWNYRESSWIHEHDKSFVPLFWGGGHLGGAMTGKKKMPSILGGQKCREVAFLAKFITAQISPPPTCRISLRRGFALHQATRSGLATKFPQRKCAANLTWYASLVLSSFNPRSPGPREVGVFAPSNIFKMNSKFQDHMMKKKQQQPSCLLYHFSIPPNKIGFFPRLEAFFFFHPWPVFFLTSEDEDTTGSHRRSPRPLTSPMFSPTIFSGVEKDILYPPQRKKAFLWNGKKIPHVFIGWKLESIYTYFWSMVGYVLLSHRLKNKNLWAGWGYPNFSLKANHFEPNGRNFLPPQTCLSSDGTQKTNESCCKIPPMFFLQ